MSKECRYFVQHAWKKELCANCFESRQDHQRAAPCTTPFIARDIKNVQGILRGLRTTAVTGSRRKKNRVAFPEELSRVIGYGGDDYSDSDGEGDATSNNVQIIEADKKSVYRDSNEDTEIDSPQESDEDRALNNLTRVNTNFNMVTANLTTVPSETKPKTVGLMLGRMQKDADGNKTTLLISVTPFGADDVSVPTARRPIERKRVDERPIALEKIVDMPLIASNNLMAMKKIEAPSSPVVASCVPDIEHVEAKPASITSTDSMAKNRDTMECEIADEAFTKIQFDGKDVSNGQESLITSEQKEPINTDPNYDDLGERTVEGESEPIVTGECPSLLDDNNSREEAGVPDGKADEDEISVEYTQAISTEPRRSFLHSDSIPMKKLTPPKSITVQSKEITKAISPDDAITPKADIKSTLENAEVTERLSESSKDDDGCVDNQSSGNGKRRMAPKPPDVNLDDNCAPLFTRKPNFKGNLKSDSPVVREKEKRERATTSSSPKLKKSLGPTVAEESPSFLIVNQPAESPEPRRSLSLSHQDISMSTISSEKLEEKKKTKSRFSLKKLLRMGGSRKDMNLMSTVGSPAGKVDEIPGTIQPKPRLEIIHPLELDGAAVEVLRHDKLISQEEHVISDSRQESVHNVTARLGKPPPPPRNGQSSTSLPSKPTARPPPPTPDNTPKSSSPVRAWHPGQHGTVAGDSIYANLAAENVAGEVRSTLAPSKPQRTASIKRENDTMKSYQSSPRDIAANRRYEKTCLDVPANSDSLDSTSSDSHDVYEFLSSSPECDSNLELRRHANEATRTNATKRNSEGGVGTDHYRQIKYTKSTFARSNSLPYCPSETESDGFYTGNEGAEEDQDWKTKNEDFVLNRVRQRRSRTVVHRSLEDNYGAVVIANHESLAQLLERLSQVDHTPLSVHLRPLSASNPRLKDFHIEPDTIRTIGKRSFFSASWQEHPVTICLSSDNLSSPVAHKEFSLVPIFEFVDQIPDELPFTRITTLTKNEDVTASVLPPYQVCSMKSYLSNLPRQLRNNTSNETIMRECCLVLLQFVTALKNLQARGIEELPKSLCNIVLCKEERDPSYRLYHLQSLHVDHINDVEEHVSLCQAALVALRELNLTNRLPVMRELLVRERAVSLSQVKAVLEYSLWGPADVTMDVWKEREIVLQRWLDLERATILHALVRTRPPLTVADEYQLIFLVQTTAKNMCEASVLLDEQRSKFHTLQQKNN